MANVYFELTREFNRDQPVALLASGQAVVFYRIAMMSEDGDWVVRESPEACDHVRAVLAARGARHRPSPPLLVVDPETLVRMKQTQRAKDYPAIREVARLLPDDLELRYTTDPDRILTLARSVTAAIDRPSVQAARDAYDELR